MADEPKEPYGDVPYADPGYQSDGKKRYPLDSEEHCRAAWSYINMPKNAAKYTAKQLAAVKGRIRAALKRYGVDMSENSKSLPGRSGLVDLPEIATRSHAGPDAASFGGTKGRTLFGHFAVFNEWTEIQDHQGRFLERNQPGAFTDSLTNHRSRIKALYDHGKDPQLGNKPLGPFEVLREDERGGYYEIGLIETSYNDEFIIPAARAGLLGASYRFSVPEGGDGWDDRPMRSTDWNPDRLPERTVLKADVYELGPVTFPAYESATASVRSVLARLDADERQTLIRELAAELRLAVDLEDFTGRPDARSAGGGDPDTEPSGDGDVSAPVMYHRQRLDDGALRVRGILT